MTKKQANIKNNNSNIELNSLRTDNEHVYEEINDEYYVDETTLSGRKKVVRFQSLDIVSSSSSNTLPSTTSPSILMPILRIDSVLTKTNTNLPFSSSISSASSTSSTSSCGIYTTNSILSNNSSFNSNYSTVFNQMVEDFLSQCTLNRKHTYVNNNKSINKKKKSNDLSILSNSSSINSSNSLNNNCNDKLSYRVTNLTLDDLKKRQKNIYNNRTTKH
jgi:hypothetical protein